MKYIDASNAIAGRLASYVAQELLTGEAVCIVNAEKAVISGNPSYTHKLFKEKVDRGHPRKGPFYPRTPERMLRRIIRGMLPHHKDRGKRAYQRLRVYTGVPEDLADKKLKRFGKAENRLETKFLTIDKVTVRLGAHKRW
ncbi:MAG: 50S ribosomal protein L13 [Nanoarchaeota archaeon]|nr:50S ribosomal protein L13 [Nanoarchaeota archaeon]